MALLAEEAREDREAGDRDGDDAADDSAEAERRALEEAAARELLAGRGRRIAASPAAAGGTAAASAGVISRTSAFTTGTWLRISDVASRAQRKPKTIAIPPPMDAIHSGLTMSPTSATAMPTANPSGQSVGGGPCSGGPGVIPSSCIRP